MTYPSVAPRYAPFAIEESSCTDSFSTRAALALVICALLFFCVGIVGFIGEHYTPHGNSIYTRLLEGSMVATAIDFVAIIVLLVVEHRQTR